MKSLLISLLILPLLAQSQSISQVQLRYFKKFNDFWTGKKSNLGIELHRINVKNSKDTTYAVFITAHNQEYETVGVSSGISFSYSSLFGFGSASASRTEAIVKQNGLDTLSFPRLERLYKIMSGIFTTVKELEVRKETLDHIVSDTMDDIEFSIKYQPNNISKFDYYFTVGAVTFNMTESDFLELHKFIRSINVKLSSVMPKV